MYNKATFARSLKSLLEKRGMTQRTLAEKLETTEVTVLLPNRKVGSNTHGTPESAASDNYI